MGDRYDDDFREKPSWRDRDRTRDRSRHVAQGDFGGQSPKWVRKEILREADKLFQGKRGKKLNPEQETARNDIHRTVGSKKFDGMVRKYLKSYGFPEDWSTLMLLLDCKDPETIENAIEKLKNLCPDQGLEEQRGFRSKLNIIAMTTKNDELRLCAEETVLEI